VGHVTIAAATFLMESYHEGQRTGLAAARAEAEELARDARASASLWPGFTSLWNEAVSLRAEAELLWALAVSLRQEAALLRAEAVRLWREAGSPGSSAASFRGADVLRQASDRLADEAAALRAPRRQEAAHGNGAPGQPLAPDDGTAAS